MLSFREIQFADVPALFELRPKTRENAMTVEQLARHGITIPSVREALATTHKGWLCADGEKVAGFCIGDRSNGELTVVAILPEYEGKGIGGRLMDLTEAWLWECGWTRAWLTTDVDTSLRAYGFYRKRGWTDWKLEPGWRWMELFKSDLPQEIRDLDRADPLRGFREQFELPAGVIYLDGNSLGALSRGTRGRIRTVVELEWGRDLITSWNGADWISLPQRVGDKIGQLIGAAKGQVIAADSTSVNLFKVLSVALRARAGRGVIVSERANFPTDLYVIEGVIEQLGDEHELVLVDGTEEAIEAMLAERGPDVAAVVLTHVHYTTSRVYDMRRLTAAAHRAGAAMVWDLSHSAGVVPVDLDDCQVDFAIGCGYKHLNGGPGAPAFIYAAGRHHDLYPQPIAGWMGDARPFDFHAGYEPARGISRYLSGTPSVIGLAALESSVELIREAPMKEIRRKSVALGDLFISLVDTHCRDLGLELASPRDGTRRGSHVSYRHSESYPLMQALIASGVIGDCRPPDLLRFGFAPLYLRYADIWHAVNRLARILRAREWDRPEFHARALVT